MTTPSTPLNVVSPDSIARQWSDLKRRVASACEKSNRLEKEVTVVGITKYVDAKTARWLVDAGCRDLGESRPQSLWEKQAFFASSTRECASRASELLGVPLRTETNENIRWHFIGHLQRNKSLKTISGLTLLHSLDSIRLADQIQRDADSIGKTVGVLIDVNISAEPNKTGLLEADLPAMLEALSGFSRLDVRGLMGMAGLHTADPRKDFAKLRELRDATQMRFGDRFQLNELSMGMSGDFEAAIEEGSTMVRVGSLLFEPIGN